MIGIVHPGSMGSAVGAALRDGGHDVAWASRGRSAATARRAEAAGLVDLGTVERLADACDLIVSLCPPADAVSVAHAFVGYAGVYVDANAVSPDRSTHIEQALRSSTHMAETLQPRPTYVAGAVVGPPPVETGKTRLYLSGPHAERAASGLGNPRFDVRVLTSSDSAAKALKMAYAAWTKGTAALLVAIRQAARDLGVEADLLEEWARSQPGLLARSEGAMEVAADRGWRWSFELDEIGRCFEAVGQPGGFGAAAAEVYARFPRPD
ncbi:MAG TPA: DUF1932 domain-containing protein [Actinomycetes bacterium]|nr:DUF1932 domain-containing protein [Actinomycetes bacterium]